MMLHFRRKKFVKRAESAARKNQFPTDLRIPPAHEPQQLNLLFRVRRKIGMTSLRRRNAIALTIPNQEGLSKSRARRQQRHRATRLRLSFIQYDEFFGCEMLDAVSRRSKIIQQHDIFDFYFPLQNSCVHRPREIRGPNVIVDYRSGDPKARRGYAIRGQIGCRLPRKFLHDKLKFRELLACKTLLENGGKPSVFLREKRKVALRAAHVTGKDHLSPCPSSSSIRAVC